ncbi:MAG: nucleotidyl transferase AbiEii/AbiGii toxin family protein [Acidobacteria bacterium]|nr:nucleotidyl transferase AbiEii/AbiGii toxin family protein [Acidobacteriota bacterium]
MKPIFLTAQKVQAVLESEEWQFCFIGGVALQRWAVPRLTNDVDLTLLTGLGNEEKYIHSILNHFEPRIDDAADFALRNRVLLVSHGNVGIDISLGALEFEESAVERSSNWTPLPDISLRTCSAEDLIVFKSFADRLQDWADVENILGVQRDLDWNYIPAQLEPLVEAKGVPEILTKLFDLRKASE